MKRPNTSSSSSGGAANYYSSYQQQGTAGLTAGAGTGYQPPVFYAADQTKTLEDTTKTYYQAEDTANQVLHQMTAQRQQILGAHGNVNELRLTAEKTKRELEDLRIKYRRKKQKLYMWIAGLSIVDLLLFIRMLQCHGNFYCF